MTWRYVQDLRYLSGWHTQRCGQWLPPPLLAPTWKKRARPKSATLTLPASGPSPMTNTFDGCGEGRGNEQAAAAAVACRALVGWQQAGWLAHHATSSTSPGSDKFTNMAHAVNAAALRVTGTLATLAWGACLTPQSMLKEERRGEGRQGKLLCCCWAHLEVSVYDPVLVQVGQTIQQLPHEALHHIGVDGA